MNLDIIIPVFNALEDLKECIESVRNSDIQNARLTIVDDCSSDPRVKIFLEDFSTQSFPMPVEILYNPVNVGFIKTCNRGMKASELDVVLLNSDAILTKNTLAEMQKTAYLEEKIGTVTPLSNNATILSVPGSGIVNHYPEGIDLEGLAEAILENPLPSVLEIPTAIGFCMYLKRSLLKSVGYFDEITFDRGYYDENDLCERAKAKGFMHVVAHTAFAYHKGSKSFGDEKFTLSQKNRLIFIKKYPNYDQEVQQFIQSNPLRPVQEIVYHCLIQQEEKILGRKFNAPEGGINYLRYFRPRNCYERPAILYLLHHPLRSQMIGGTEYHIGQLIQRLKFKYYMVVVSLEADQVIVEEFCDDFYAEYAFGIPESIRKKKVSLPLSYQGGTKHFDDSSFWPSDIFQEMLFTTFEKYSFRFDLIHIHHLMNNTLDFIPIAKALGKPVLMTLHDYYLVCPSYNLLNIRNQYCGIDDIAFTRCGNCFGNHLSLERQRIQSYLAGVDLAIFPSKSAQSVFEKIYTLKNAIVLPHGIEKEIPSLLEASSSLPHSQNIGLESSTDSDLISNNDPLIKRDEPLKLLFLGYVDYQKGIEFILKIMEYYQQFGNYANLEFHFLGAIPDQFAIALKSMATSHHLHGTYQQKELSEKLTDINPHFVCLLSNWPETFSYTLSESLASGYPVIVSPYGALKDRVESTGVGYVLPDYSLNGFIKVIHFIQTHPENYGELLKRVQAEPASISINEMLQKYDSLYQEFLENPPLEIRRSNPAISTTQQQHLSTDNIGNWLDKNLYYYPRQAFYKFKNSQPFAPGLCGIHSEDQLKQFSHDPMLPNYQFLWVLPQGCLLGYYGFLMTPDHVVIHESSIQRTIALEPLLQNPSLKASVQSPKIYSGTVVCMASEWYFNYYHFLLDILPRWQFIEHYCARHPNVSVDQVLISPSDLPFQQELFLKLGIQPDQMITLAEDSCIQAETLLYPSFVTFPGEPQLESIQWVRGLFELPPQGALRLYISRKNAQTRHLANEVELEKLLARYQFETVFLEEMSVGDQASMFAQASCVIGQYGSGLANLIFAHPGTEVIELVQPKMVSLRYRKIAHLLGLNYQSLKTLQEGQGADDSEIDTPFHVPLSLLEAMLEELFFNDIAINRETKMTEPVKMREEKSNNLPSSQGGTSNQKPISNKTVPKIEKNRK